MQGDRRHIDAANARDHAVTASGLAAGDKLGQKGLADSIPAAIGADVNGVFHREAIAFAWAKERCVAVADDVAVKFRDEVR